MADRFLTEDDLDAVFIAGVESQQIEQIQYTLLQVEKAKQEWETAVDALPELICIVDETCRVLRANRTLERWQLGSVTAVEGKDFHMLVHPDCQSDACALAAMFISENEDTFEPRKLINYDSFLDKHLEIDVWPTSADPKANRVVLVRDISRRSRMEAELRERNNRLTTLNTINHAILHSQSSEEIGVAALAHLQTVIPFQEGQILMGPANAETYVVLSSWPQRRYVRSERLGTVTKDRSELKPYWKTDLSDLTPLNPNQHDCLKRDIPFIYSFPLVANQRQIGYLEIAARSDLPIITSRQQIVIEVAEIVTIAILQAQAKRRLSRTNSELQELLSAKEESMQTLGHELRSPVGLIKGFVELLQQGEFGPINSNQNEILGILDKRGEELVFLIERLFSMDQLNSDTLERAPVSITDLIAQIQKSWLLVATNRDIRLELDFGPDIPELMADPVLLRQVITNLLDNALKYSFEEKSITIRAIKQRQAVKIAVCDQGRGIAPEEVERIFERFYRVKQVRGNHPKGLGIGLAFCKSVVAAHGGRLGVKSAGLGQGSTFWFTLPTV